MTYHRRIIFVFTGFILFGAGVAPGQEFTLDWLTPAGGGTSIGGDFAVSGTFGQPATETLSDWEGNYIATGGFWPGATFSCLAPQLLAARSVAEHAVAPGTWQEFYVDLDIANAVANRTSESRDSGIRILDFLFDQVVYSGYISVNGGMYEPMVMLDGGTRGRVAFPSAWPNAAVYTVTIHASTGPDCDLTGDICVVALAGDFDDDDRVTAEDKAELLGFVFQPITQTNARYDIQVEGSESGIIDVADVGAWTGFFGTAVDGAPCP